MSDTLLAAIVGAIAGVITGSLSSLIAPWVNWGIERKKERREERKQLIKTWRGEIISTIQSLKRTQWKIDNWNGVDYDGSDLFRCELGDVLEDSSEFYALKPYLSQKTLDKLAEAKGSVWDAKAEGALNSMLKDIQTIEKKWKLV